MVASSKNRRKGTLTKLAVADNIASVKLVDVLTSDGRVEIWRGRWPNGEGATIHALATDATRVERELFMNAARKLTVLGQRKRLAGVVKVAAMVPQHQAYVTRTTATATLADVPMFQWELERCLELMRRLGRALAGLHRANLVHGALMPPNVMLDKRREPVLGDIGAVAVVQSYGRDSQQPHAYKLYTAPELRRGRKSTTRSDIFSFGRLLWFCMLGEEPYDEEAEIPELGELHGLPQGLVRIIRRCTVKRPDERYATIDEVLTDLSLYTEVTDVGLALPEMSGSFGRAAGVERAVSEPPPQAKPAQHSSFPPMSGPAPGRSWSDPLPGPRPVSSIPPGDRNSPVPDSLPPWSYPERLMDDEQVKLPSPLAGLGSAIVDDEVVDATALDLDGVLGGAPSSQVAAELNRLDEQLRLSGEEEDGQEEEQPFPLTRTSRPPEEAQTPTPAVAVPPPAPLPALDPVLPAGVTRKRSRKLLSDPPPPSRPASSRRANRKRKRARTAVVEQEDVLSFRMRAIIGGSGVVLLMAVLLYSYLQLASPPWVLAVSMSSAALATFLIPRVGPALVWRLSAIGLMALAVWLLQPTAHVARWARARTLTRGGAQERGLRIKRWRERGEMSFEQLDLRGTDFTAADLSHVRFNGSDLRGARFHRTILRGASMKGANVAGADFSGAVLSGIDVAGMNGWRNSTCDDESAMPEPWICEKGLPKVSPTQ